MDLSTIRRWDSTALDRFADALDARVTSRDGLRNAYRLAAGTRTVEGAVGERYRGAAVELERTVARGNERPRQVAGTAREAGESVRTLQRELRRLERAAAEHRLLIAPDGRLTTVGEPTVGEPTVGEPAGGETLRRRTMAQLTSAVNALVGRARATDDATASALDQLDETRLAAPGHPVRAGLPAEPPRADLPPTEVAAYWRMLTDAQRTRLIDADPLTVGRRDGIPAADRDRANRRALPAVRRELQRTRDDLTRQLDGRLTGGLLTDADDRRLATIRKLDDLDAVERTLREHPDARLMLVDPASGNRLRAAVAVGDPDTAEHLSVAVPGMRTTPSDSLPSMVREAAALRTEAERQLGGRGRVASIAWIGYEPPGIPQSGWIEERLSELDATSETTALRAAPDLARFYAGLDAASTRPDPHITALGHSYGSLVTAQALRLYPSGVDSAVFSGSPGTGDGVVDARSLHVGDAYHLRGRHDLVPLARFWHGADELPILESQAGVDGTGQPREGADRHADYTRPGSDGRLRMSGYNIAAVVAGLQENLVLDGRPR